MSEDKLFFMHIPKTAGVSARSFLGQHFAAHRICQLLPSHREATGYARKADSLGDYDFVHGHIWNSTIEQLAPGFRKLTFLRHPVERTYSEYRFWRAQKTGQYAETGAATSMNFGQFIRAHGNVQSVSSNRQARFLLVSAERPWSDYGEDEALDLALEKLEGFELCGTTDLLPESLQILSARRGWCPPETLPRLNTSDADGAPDIDDQTRELLLVQNKVDLALYDAARRSVLNTSASLNIERIRLAFEDKFLERFTSDWSPADMEGPIHGWGWYERESDVNGYWRWTGPGPVAVAYARVTTGRPRLLRIRTWDFGDSRAARLARLDVNGQQLAHRSVAVAHGTLLEALVPSHLFQNHGLARIEIEVDAVRIPAELDSQSADKRPLRLAVSGIELTPAP